MTHTVASKRVLRENKKAGGEGRVGHGMARAASTGGVGVSRPNTVGQQARFKCYRRTPAGVF
eukprot:scaffold6453_cov79-Isochrysis_galbana.AAC.2